MEEIRPWVAEARLARDKIAQVPRGKRDEELRQIAKPRNGQTLRRAIAAVDFLDRLKGETEFPAGRLEAFPVAAIEYLLRWYKRDPSGALQAAEKLLRGEYTTHGLGKAEKETRTEVFAATGKALEADYRRSITDIVKNIASRHTFRTITLATDADLEPLGWHIKRAIDFAFLDENKRLLVAFVVVGPYRDIDLYHRRCFDWVARAHALLNLIETVYLVIPDNGEGSISRFDKLCQILRIDPYRLRIEMIEVRRL